jgi:hypothetical protein
VSNSVVAFARSDDYFFGVLHSSAHEIWARWLGGQVREVESGFRYTPTTTFETFPFPQAGADQTSDVAAAAKTLDRLRRGWLFAEGGSDDQPRPRTLTNLYNEQPTWLRQAHERLNRTVHAAYGWPFPTTANEVLTRLVDLNPRATSGLERTT